MGRQGPLYLLLGCWLPLLVLGSLYNVAGSPIYLNADWLWITQMYAMFAGIISILGLAFYFLGRR
jgi:hypothetical protein